VRGEGVRLEGRIALISGAARGIGAAVARRFVREGAKVAINYRPGGSRQEAELLAREMIDSGGQAIAVAADVSNPEAVDRMVSDVREQLGPVDILVANAARSKWTSWNEIGVDEWDQIVAVNLRGLYLLAKAVYPDMKAQGYGKIITLSSVMAKVGSTGSLHYVTTKAGILGFTRALAREIGPDGILVNCVMPGSIRTERELENFPDQDAVEARAFARQSLTRRGVPADLEGVFVFLASSESDFMTGQTLCVDGGWVFL
jgi:3-oxoacyl-[acyl-carrier protein] reductase